MAETAPGAYDQLRGCFLSYRRRPVWVLDLRRGGQAGIRRRPRLRVGELHCSLGDEVGSPSYDVITDIISSMRDSGTRRYQVSASSTNCPFQHSMCPVPRYDSRPGAVFVVTWTNRHVASSCFHPFLLGPVCPYCILSYSSPGCSLATWKVSVFPPISAVIY